MKFNDLFKTQKPIFAMLHLKGNTHENVLERAGKEIEIYYDNGIDAVMVENYFGDVTDCAAVLNHLDKNYKGETYGVNILGDNEAAFSLANRFNAKIVQLDSVAGHLPPAEDAVFEKRLNALRRQSNVTVLGGVRFKYQPVLSGRSLAEDLEFGKKRCDAIVVTGDGTGMDTGDAKINEFKEILGDFPLIVGAGVTADTVRRKLSRTNGAIIGSYFKEQHQDSGEVIDAYVKEVMKNVKL